MESTRSGPECREIGMDGWMDGEGAMDRDGGQERSRGKWEGGREVKQGEGGRVEGRGGSGGG